MTTHCEEAMVGVDHSNWVNTNVRVLFAAALECPRNKEGTRWCQASARHKCGVSEVVYGTGESHINHGWFSEGVPRMVQAIEECPLLMVEAGDGIVLETAVHWNSQFAKA